MDSFDFVVIGAGPGGYVSAIRAAQLGLKTALIEKRASLGGTCLNVGCIPSKALLESSERYHEVLEGLSIHGIMVQEAALDLNAMMARKDRVVTEITEGVKLLIKKNKIKFYRGSGVLAGNNKVTVENPKGVREVEGKRIVLALGSLPIELPGLPFDNDRIVSSTEALSFDRVPRHLVVVGAGAIGLELGSVWKRLGAQVTVVELLPKVAPFADDQVSKALERALTDQGIAFRLNTKVTGAKKQGDSMEVALQKQTGEGETLTCDKILVAVGRRPCVEGAGLKEANVALDAQGRVQVDETFQTSVPGVYAVGDLIRGPMLAHKAEDEGIALAELAAGGKGHVNYHAIPNVIYTWPELAQVGLTEEEVKKEGIPYKTGRSYFRANGRARSMNVEEGLVKVLAHKETDRILGVHILGPNASDLIAEAVAVMEFAGSAEDVARTCHAHPTLSEVFREAAMAVDRRSIHG